MNDELTAEPSPGCGVGALTTIPGGGEGDDEGDRVVIPETGESHFVNRKFSVRLGRSRTPVTRWWYMSIIRRILGAVVRTVAVGLPSSVVVDPEVFRQDVLQSELLPSFVLVRLIRRQGGISSSGGSGEAVGNCITCTGTMAGG